MPISSIISDFAQPFVVLRRGESYQRKADFFAGPLTPLEGFTASITPAQGEELLQLPEGERTIATITIISQQELIVTTPPTTESDLIFYLGEYYKVIKSQRWQFGSFFRAIAQKMAQQPNVKPIYFGKGLVGGVGEAFVKTFLLQVQSQRELYFEITIVNLSERIHVALRPELGAPTFYIDDVQTAFTIKQSISVDGETVNVWMSPAVTVGLRKVRVS